MIVKRLFLSIYLFVCRFVSWWTCPGRSILWRSSRPCTGAQSNLSPKCRDGQKREPGARNRVRHPAIKETINLVNFLWKCQDTLFLETFGKYLNVKHTWSMSSVVFNHKKCAEKFRWITSILELDWSDIGNCWVWHDTVSCYSSCHNVCHVQHRWIPHCLPGCIQHDVKTHSHCSGRRGAQNKK